MTARLPSIFCLLWCGLAPASLPHTRDMGLATNTLTLTLSNTVVLLYDSNGNLTNDGIRSFAYDSENRLTTNWVASAWKSEFVYDGLGRRRIERDYGWQGGAWSKTNETRLVYD